MPDLPFFAVTLKPETLTTPPIFLRALVIVQNGREASEMVAFMMNPCEFLAIVAELLLESTPIRSLEPLAICTVNLGKIGATDSSGCVTTVAGGVRP